ncbi:PKD domain-containing protein [Niallia sp. MER TA 168]|nr:PKD domain-containing protein [Niallia sp. MER TA 168]MCM3364340.1 PKD domain-containing protein [Niallia sp. MER TA 168]
MRNAKIFFLIPILFFLFLLFIQEHHAHASTGDEDIYNVSSTVKNNWNNLMGSKDFTMTSGRKIVYDVYSDKFVTNGYQVTTKNFGKGSQKYIRFSGWSVLFGHREHTSSNQDTYIVARKSSGDSGIGTVKIYKTVQGSLDATEDLEYNNQGAGIWNQCPSSATNRWNDDCNMKYQDVSFNAYLPLEELFNKKEKANWDLFIVKKVQNQIVYTPLILPFEFSNKAYEGGKLSLSSGTNTNTLEMNAEGVLRRKTPRESAPSVIDELGNNRYFTQGKTYTKVDFEESQTAVWYGVRSPHDSNKTKWANTAYFTFKGDQAKLSFQPNRPPIAKWEWDPSNNVYNDTTVKMINNSSDPDGDPLTYKWYRKPYGSADSNYVQISTAKTPSSFKIAKGKYTFKLVVSDGKEEAEAGHALYVNNRPPVAKWEWDPSNTIYNDTPIKMVNSSSDPDGDSLTYRWERKPYGSADSNYVTVSTAKTPSSFTIGKGDYTFKLTVSDGEDESVVGHALYVINRPPIADFTWNPSTIYNDTSVSFSNKSSDVDGDSLTYKWETQKPNETTWSTFSTSKDPPYTLNKKGVWKVRLTVSDGEASHNVTKNITVQNRAPAADFSWSPSTIYNDTSVSFSNKSSDADGDSLTYKWETQKPDDTNWSTISTSKNPSYTLNKKGIWKVRLTVSDGEASNNVTKNIIVKNRAPNADFTWSPSTIYNDTSVSFSNKSSDADGDSLRYKWETQKPNETTWSSISTSKEPSYTLNKKGVWKVRLTVSDGEASHNVTKNVTVQNRTPVADFIWNPSTIYNDTSVSFTNKSTDADKDSLTFKWEAQKPNESTWSTISSSKDPSYTLNKKGVWKVRLTVSDGEASHNVTKNITVQNRIPVADFTWSPSTIYNDTSVSFTNKSTDADKDSLTFKWEAQKPNESTWSTISTSKDPSYTLNKKGVWKVRLTVSDGEASHNVIKNITVQNRIPVADFTWNPSTIYNDTSVSFTNKSTDADKDSLTYKWEAQKPNESTWSTISTSKDPSYTLNKKGVWKVRLTVSDGEASHNVTKNVTVKNRAPVADFTWNPTTIYNDTTVSFTNKSFDTDGDPLTNIWEYQEPNKTTWTKFSTEKNPKNIFTKVGDYKIKLTVTDDDGATGTKEKTLKITNRPPQVTLTYTPKDVYEGDTVNVCIKVIDLDKQPMTVKLFLEKDYGNKQTVLTKSNINSGEEVCYVFVPDVGNYDFTTEVDDGHDKTTVDMSFYAKPLIIKGHVNHTADWKKKHEKLGNTLDKFFSGEKFLLEADTSPYETIYVKSTLSAVQMDNKNTTSPVDLNKVTNILYNGSLYEEKHQYYPTMLKVGEAKFEFEVKYKNGVIKKDTVKINIIDNAFNSSRYHRKF